MSARIAARAVCALLALLLLVAACGAPGEMKPAAQKAYRDGLLLGQVEVVVATSRALHLREEGRTDDARRGLAVAMKLAVRRGFELTEEGADLGSDPAVPNIRAGVEQAGAFGARHSWGDAYAAEVERLVAVLSASSVDDTGTPAER